VSTSQSKDGAIDPQTLSDLPWRLGKNSNLNRHDMNREVQVSPVAVNITLMITKTNRIYNSCSTRSKTAVVYLWIYCKRLTISF